MSIEYLDYKKHSNLHGKVSFAYCDSGNDWCAQKKTTACRSYVEKGTESMNCLDAYIHNV